MAGPSLEKTVTGLFATLVVTLRLLVATTKFFVTGVFTLTNLFVSARAFSEAFGSGAMVRVTSVTVMPRAVPDMSLLGGFSLTLFASFLALHTTTIRINELPFIASTRIPAVTFDTTSDRVRACIASAMVSRRSGVGVILVLRGSLPVARSVRFGL